jgi:hypothetical protein
MSKDPVTSGPGDQTEASEKMFSTSLVEAYIRAIYRTERTGMAMP